MSAHACPWKDEHAGPELSARQLAEIFMRSNLHGRSISDPEVHNELRGGFMGGARPGDKGHPCLMWMSENKGIRYEVGHDGKWKMLTWSMLAAMDPEQLDLFEVES